MADRDATGIQFVLTGPNEISGARSTVATITKLLVGSEHRVDLLLPYLDDTGIREIATALGSALDRDVTVRLVVRNGRGSWDANVRGLRELTRHVETDLLTRNLDLFEVSDRESDGTESGLHAKVVAVDGHAAYVGSANLTRNGLRENIEVGVLLEGSSVSALHQHVTQLIHRDIARPLSWQAIRRGSGRPGI